MGERGMGHALGRLRPAWGIGAVNRSGRARDCSRSFEDVPRSEMEQRGDGAGLARFVISEFERYLACGIPGFARVRCCSCGNEMLVTLSCKRAALRLCLDFALHGGG